MIKAIRKQWLIFETRIVQKIAIALERRGIIPHDPIEERLYAEARSQDEDIENGGGGNK